MKDHGRWSRSEGINEIKPSVAIKLESAYSERAEKPVSLKESGEAMLDAVGGNVTDTLSIWSFYLSSKALG